MTGMRDFARAVYLPGTEVSTDSPVEDSFLHLYRVWRPQLFAAVSQRPACIPRLRTETPEPYTEEV